MTPRASALGNSSLVASSAERQQASRLWADRPFRAEDGNAEVLDQTGDGIRAKGKASAPRGAPARSNHRAHPGKQMEGGVDAAESRPRPLRGIRATRRDVEGTQGILEGGGQRHSTQRGERANRVSKGFACRSRDVRGLRERRG